MNRYQTYFGQVVTDTELNEIFNGIADAQEAFISEFGYSGIAAGADIVPQASPNLSVLITGPAIVYDQFGRRMSFGSAQTVNINQDENGNSTAVTGSLNEKYISIFIQFVGTPTDPRIDELGETVFFKTVAGYKLIVAAGSDAAAGAAPRPLLRGDAILLGDIRLPYGATAVNASNIDTSRSQWIYNLTGSPLSVKAKTLQAVLQASINAINGINTGTLLVPATPGTPSSVPSGSVQQVIKSLLDLINGKANIAPPDDLSHFAKFDASQEFTAKQTFNGLDLKDLLNMEVENPSRGLLGTAQVPGSDLWYKIFDFKWGSPDQGQYWKAYTGNDASTRGCFVMCVNASWDGSKWVRNGNSNTLASSALIFTYNRIRISTVVGQANWAEWPSNLPDGATADGRGLHVVDNVNITGGARIGGDLAVNGDITGDDIHSASVTTNAVTVQGHVQANSVTVHGLLSADGVTVPEGNVQAMLVTAPNLVATVLVKSPGIELTGDARIDGFYKYKTPKTFVKPLNLAKAWLTGEWVFGTNQNLFNHHNTGDAPDASMLVPLELPHASKLTKIELAYKAQGGSFGALFLVRPQIVLPADPGPENSPAGNTMVASGAAVNGSLTADNAWHTAIWFPGEPLPSDGQTIFGNTLYYLLIVCAHDADCSVGGVNVTFQDHGLTNF